MPKTGVPTNPWFWTVLTLLHERPMHPYEIDQLVRHRHKDLFVEHKRGSLYGVVDRLVADDLIAVDSVDRSGGRPERTVYRITGSGRARFSTWLQEELAVLDRRDLPRFVFALEKIAHLPPARASERLAARLEQVREQLAGLETALRSMRDRDVPRVSALEVEYAARIRATEADWLAELVVDVDAGTLTWTPPEEDA